jgi:hypothetical protein
MRYSLVVVMLLASVAAVAAEPIGELRGYKVGVPMSECPSESLKVDKRGNKLMCKLPVNSLANQPLSDFALIINNGIVEGVMANTGQRGQHANSQIRDALLEKFGPATDTKAHINSYIWQDQNGLTLAFDGWKGTVILIDRNTVRKGAAESAKANKDDL